MQYDHLADNQANFLQRIAYLAMTSSKGPFKNINFNEAINNQKPIDNPADVIPGDNAYNGYQVGKVVSNVLAGAKRTITVKFPMIDKPAGVTIEEWNATDKSETEVFIISVVESNSTVINTQHNPFLELASIGVLFVRNLNGTITTNPAITITSGAVAIQEGGPATSVTFSQPGVSVQKTVNGTPSGATVVANGSGVASIPNGATAGQEVRFVVSKADYNTATFGPYVVTAP